MNFEHTLQQWVLLDNQIKTYNDKIKELREKKDMIEKTAIQFANNNQLVNSHIKLTNNNLKIVNTKISSPLTFKYLEKSLGEIIKNSDQLERIINYIKNNRDTKIIQEIKRLSNN